jgi:prefoldin subunit 5
MIKTEEYQERLKEKDETIRLLRRQIQELKKERKALGEKLAAIAAGLKG